MGIKYNYFSTQLQVSRNIQNNEPQGWKFDFKQNQQKNEREKMPT